MNTTATLAKGTKVRIISENQANVAVGAVHTIVCRFELPDSQGGRHYRISSTRTDKNFAGKMVPASALEVIAA